MTDCISREAEIRFFNNWVDDLDKQINDSVNYPHLKSDYKVCKTQLLDCIHAIKEMPAADVVEVVRCKDCTYFNHVKCQEERAGLCEHFNTYVYISDYCSDGDRRDDNG